ncbi:hypothetical protein [Calidifontibacillus erzurumensis]|uniref:Uncharacterized protein n=1 Tax=Calidifontibacillus erzurumensis TaxID=2741433 RepID=A0A8J8GBH4_9BACI|nr:hypothetical protein [Calidifontibacillus erzurumensis]NSL50627.1 hypothetical protein [Calidifontibacillus erzurumensis]
MEKNKEHFKEMIDKLRKNELDHLLVTKQEFLVFREVLMEQKDKEKIVGEAKKGGQIIYRFKGD